MHLEITSSSSIHDTKMEHGNCSELSVLRAFLKGTDQKEIIGHLGTKQSNHLQTGLLSSRILCICIIFGWPRGLDASFCSSIKPLETAQ